MPPAAVTPTLTTFWAPRSKKLLSVRPLSPGELGQRDRDPVVGVKGLQLVAVLGEHHPAVGQDPVDVHDEKSDLSGSCEDGARRHQATRRDWRATGTGAAAVSAWASPGSAT